MNTDKPAIATDQKSKTFSCVLVTFVLIVVAICLIFLIDIFLSPSNGSQDIKCELNNGVVGKCVIKSACDYSAAEQKSQCGPSDDKVCCSTLKYSSSEKKLNALIKTFDETGFLQEPIPVERVGIGSGTFKNIRTCGKRNSDRIINGNETVPGEFPFFAALKYNIRSNTTGKDFTLNCGGSLITDRYVLTAAHCIQSSLFSVRLGEHDIMKEIDCEGCKPAIDVDIEKILIHSNFTLSQTTLGFDIALLRLKEAVTFTSLIKPVCLPEMSQQIDPDDAKHMTVIGFGSTLSATESTVLIQAQIPFVPVEECIDRLKKMSTVKTLFDGQMCAGGEAADSCQGDSGGPLVTFGENDRGSTVLFLFGIVSFGLPCGVAVAVYTDVRYFSDWIFSNLES